MSVDRSTDGGKTCYLDWDCTLTANHMYHLLRPMKRESAEADKMWGSSKDRAKKDAGFASIVSKLNEQYALWGRKDSGSLQQLVALTKNSTPLIDMADENEKLIYDDLKVHLFGDNQRRCALDEFIKTTSRKKERVCILTRGLTGCVYSCLLTYFDHWLQLPNIMIVDYAGICLGPGIQPVSLKSKLLQSRVKPKLVQINEMEFGNWSNTETMCTLIDDSWEEEISGLTGEEMIVDTRLSFPLVAISCPISLGGESNIMHLRIGGTPRNGDGLTTEDLNILKEVL